MRRRAPYLRRGVVALAVLVVIGIGVTIATVSPGGSGHSLPGDQVAGYLASSIQSQRHLSSTPEVHCPASVALQKGGRFSCTLVERPHPVVVEVTQTDSRGDFTYTITDRPPPSAPGTSRPGS